MTWTEAWDMPVTVRKWYIDRKNRQAEDKKGNGREQRPNRPPPEGGKRNKT